jgi:hypothetical protein
MTKNQLALSPNSNALVLAQKVFKTVRKEAGRGAVIRVSDTYIARVVDRFNLGSDDILDLVYLHAKQGVHFSKINRMLSRGLEIAEILMIYGVYAQVRDYWDNHQSGERHVDIPNLDMIEGWIKAFKIGENEDCDEVARDLIEQVCEARRLLTQRAQNRSEWFRLSFHAVMRYEKSHATGSPADAVEALLGENDMNESGGR